MMDEQHKINGEESLAELLRLAGPRPRVADDVKARVRASVHEEWQSELAGRRRVRRGVLGGLAAAAAMAGVLLFLVDRTPAPPLVRATVARVEAVDGSAKATLETQSLLPAGATVSAGTAIETAFGSTVSLRWANATLRLDGGTRLRLESRRTATLEAGAVYFSSETTGGQVVVRTPFGAIHDVGTQFEVRLSDAGLRVRVREGRIDLHRASGSVSAEAGTELVVTSTNVVRRAIPRTGDAWAWVERAAPRLLLEGLTLDEVVRRVAREKGIDVDWRSSARAKTLLHGKVPLNPDEALQAAAAAAGVTYRVENDKLVVR